MTVMAVQNLLVRVFAPNGTKTVVSMEVDGIASYADIFWFAEKRY